MLNRQIVTSYIKDHFAEQDIKWGENVVQLNTPFKPDKKFHLGVCMTEEKLGLWKDLKPPQDSGNFYKLVSLMTGRNIDDSKMYLIDRYYHLINSSDLIKTDDGLKEKLIKKGYLKISVPRGVDLIIKNGQLSSINAGSFLKFLSSKGVSPETIEDRRIMYGYDGQYTDYVVIPFYDDDMNLIYWVGRHRKEKRYKNAPNSIAPGKGSGIGYNINTNEKDVVLVEGIFDALKIKDIGIALLGCSITKEQVDTLLKKPRDRVVVAMDNYLFDTAGKDGVIASIRLIREKIDPTKTKLYVFNWESEDYKKYKDFSRCPFDVTIDMILENSEEYNDDTSDLKINMLNAINSGGREEEELMDL